MIKFALSFASTLVLGVLTLQADENPSPSAAPKGFANLKAPTTGGKQFWTDELFFHDWRIQRNAITGHYRLLDGKDYRHTWGNFEHCRKQLDKIRQDKRLPAMSGKAVIVLHGLGRSRSSMAGMSKFLRERGKYTVLNVAYASTRGDLSIHARSLARIVENLEGIEEINFVAHSLGNLVIRHYLRDQTNAEKKRQPDPRIRHIVMLAPPNNGAQMAEKFKKNLLFSTIYGKSGEQLATEWEKVKLRLATPECQFGIIAGGRGNDSGSNPLLKGDDDFVVTVEETKLAGARDFAVVPVLHTFIMNDDKVKQYTLRFFQHGHFIAEDKRQPIKAEPTKPAKLP